MELLEPSLIVLELSSWTWEAADAFVEMGSPAAWMESAVSTLSVGHRRSHTVWPANIRGHVNHVKVAQVQVQIAVA